jgi:hypothetical protein
MGTSYEPPPQSTLLLSFGLRGPDAQFLAPHLHSRLGVRLKANHQTGDFEAPPLEATTA